MAVHGSNDDVSRCSVFIIAKCMSCIQKMFVFLKFSKVATFLSSAIKCRLGNYCSQVSKYNKE